MKSTHGTKFSNMYRDNYKAIYLVQRLEINPIAARSIDSAKGYKFSRKNVKSARETKTDGTYCDIYKAIKFSMRNVKSTRETKISITRRGDYKSIKFCTKNVKTTHGTKLSTTPT